MKTIVKVLTAARILSNRLIDTARSWYWRQEILRNGGTVGRNFLIRKGASISLARGGKVTLGENVTLAERSRIHVGSDGRVSLGSGTFLGIDSLVAARSSVRIGDGSQIAHGVTIIDHDHDPFALQVGDSSAIAAPRPITIGANVWVGAGAILLKGVQVGDGSVIAAGAVTTRSVPTRNVARGLPAQNHSLSPAENSLHHGL